MLNRESQIQLAKMIRRLGVKFVDGLPDEEAIQDENTLFIDKWSGEKSYVTGKRVQYNGVIYKAIQDVIPNPTWNPEETPSLWAKVLIPDPDIIPEWQQPDSTNGYSTGDKVRHYDKIWVSVVDDNIWEPGVEGTESLWSEVTD